MAKHRIPWKKIAYATAAAAATAAGIYVLHREHRRHKYKTEKDYIMQRGRGSKRNEIIVDIDRHSLPL